MIESSAAVILVVDDDPSQRELLAGFLQSCGYCLRTAASGAEAIARLTAEPVAMLISDVRMPGMTGLELLRCARAIDQALPVLMVTGYADIRDAVEVMRDGALNYLEKPIDLEELRAMVAAVLGERRDIDDLPMTATAAPVDLPLPSHVIAVSAAMREVLRQTAMVAPYDSRVLITGESGTGKEVIADLIQQWSKRCNAAMIRVNCAAIPELLLESELFGHERGAFTGATAARVGRFEEADGGIIFLDEIAEMPAALQAKLLRVTQNGSFQRLGANRERQVNVRVLAATNRDLEAEVAAGRFREDLYYRLNVFEINLPPLRERSADILPLANHFAAQHAQGRHRLSPAVAASLSRYQWPGNVRELQNAMERAVMMARGGVILPEHLPQRLSEAIAGSDVALAASAPSSGCRLRDVEDSVILQTLRLNNFNRSETARALGISRRALIYKINRLDADGHAVKS